MSFARQQIRANTKRELMNIIKAQTLSAKARCMLEGCRFGYKELGENKTKVCMFCGAPNTENVYETKGHKDDYFNKHHNGDTKD